MLGSILDKFEDHVLRRFLERNISQRVGNSSPVNVSRVPGYDRRSVDGGALDLVWLAAYGAVSVRDVFFRSGSSTTSAPRRYCKKPEPCATDHLIIPIALSALLMAIPIAIGSRTYGRIFGKFKRLVGRNY